MPAQVRSPIKWVGGKLKIRKKILEVMPPEGTYSCYVEPFGGAAWVLLAKPPSSVEVLNDIDEELINFWTVVKYRLDELLPMLRRFEVVSQARFSRLLATHPSTLGEVARAHRFYYLIMASWGGEFKSARFQMSTTDSAGGNRLVGALSQLENRLTPVHRRLKKVVITRLDWRDCIDRFDSPRTLMYLDPPYPGNNCNYVHNMVKMDEHKALASRLRRTRGKWILSLADRPELRSLYRGYYFESVSFPSGMESLKGRVNEEMLVTNYSPVHEWAVYRFVTSRTLQADLRIGDTVHGHRKRGSRGVRGRIEGYDRKVVRIRTPEGRVGRLSHRTFVNRSAIGRASHCSRMQGSDPVERFVFRLRRELRREVDRLDRGGTFADLDRRLVGWVRRELRIALGGSDGREA